MKKILFIFVLFFISINNVAANQCSGETKACVVCVYETNTFNVTYVVKSDGTSGAKDPVVTNDYVASSGYTKLTVNNHISGGAFISTKDNKLKCLSNLYFVASGGRNGSTYDFYDTIMENNKAKSPLKTKDSYNNDLTLNGKDTNDSKSITCSYDAKLVTSTAGGATVGIKVQSDGESYVKLVSPTNYKLNDKQATVEPSVFKSGNTLKCPTLYSTCGGSDGNNFCSISTESLTVTPDKPQTPDADKDADELEEYNKNGGKWVKPENDLNINLDFSKGVCGALTKDMMDFLQWLLDVIRIAGITLAVVLGIMDYVKATASSKEDNIAAANKNFSKRLLSVALLFLAPTIITFVLQLLNIGTTAANPSCGLS